MFYDHGGKDGDYVNSVDGYMLADAPIGYKIQVMATTDTEGPDYLRVLDGYSTTFWEKARTSGRPGNLNTTTSNNQAYLHFHSDGSIVYSGYVGTISMLEDDRTQYNIPKTNAIDLTEEHVAYLMEQGIMSMKVYDSNGADNGYENGCSGSLRFNLPEGYQEASDQKAASQPLHWW